MIWLLDTSVVVLGRMVAFPEGPNLYAISFDPIWTATVWRCKNGFSLTSYFFGFTNNACLF